MTTNRDNPTGAFGLFSSLSGVSRRERLSRILTEALELSEQCSINHDITHQEEQSSSAVSQMNRTSKKDDDTAPPRQ